MNNSDVLELVAAGCNQSEIACHFRVSETVAGWVIADALEEMGRHVRDAMEFREFK